MRSYKKTSALVAILSAIIAALTLAAGIAAAQEWPIKNITFIVPGPPGGSVDPMARLIAQELTTSLGQPVIVENLPGAGGAIGLSQVMNAPADGYTFGLVSVATHAINYSLFPDLPYTPEGFEDVTLLGAGPLVLAVNAQTEFQTFDDIVKAAKAAPGSLNYASSGNGSSGHLAMERINYELGIKINHIPYQGGAPAMTDVLAGQVPMFFTNVDVALPHIEAGTLRAIATTGAERSALYPDTPTLQEAGLAGFEVTSWIGLAAPAGTSPEIVGKMQEAIAAALATPTIAERLASSDYTGGGISPEDFSTFVDAEIASWALVVEAAGAVAE